jgi:hypothetical protein
VARIAVARYTKNRVQTVSGRRDYGTNVSSDCSLRQHIVPHSRAASCLRMQAPAQGVALAPQCLTGPTLPCTVAA